MKRFFGSLIVSAAVSVLVATPHAVGQAPRSEPSAAPVAVTQELQTKEAVKKAQEAFVKARKKAQADNEKMRAQILAQQAKLARPANLENMVQQYMRQARPLVRAELIFVRKICDLDMEHFQRINQDVEAEFKEVVKKVVEARQQGQRRVQFAGGVEPAQQSLDALSLLREALASVMKKDLAPEQFGRYQAEVEKRDAYRKQSAVRYLVDAIDRDLFLSDQQRLQLTESLSSHWDQSWSMTLEYRLYNNQQTIQRRTKFRGARQARTLANLRTARSWIRRALALPLGRRSREPRACRPARCYRRSGRTSGCGCHGLKPVRVPELLA